MSKSSEAVKKWRKATKLRIVAAMGSECQCCTYKKCIESLDLHHINPEDKEFSFGAMRANPRAWPLIVIELRKCILVCRNCHGELHYGLREIPQEYAKFDESYEEYKSPPRRTSSNSFHYRVDWDQYDLTKLIQTKSAPQIADIIGISTQAVHFRLKKLGIKNPH